MLAAFLITFREALEAVLVIGVIITLLKKLKQPILVREVWWGMIAALITSVAIGYGISELLGGLTDYARELLEGSLMLLAVALLTVMIFWLARQESVAERLRIRVAEKITQQVKLGVAAVAFFSVLREGIETVIFLFAASQLDPVGAFQGFLTGILGAISIGYIFFAGLSCAPLRRFFQITNVLLLLFAAGVAANAIGVLQGIGLLPFGLMELYNLQTALNDHELPGLIFRALFGYNDNPTVLELLVYLTYIVPVGALLWRRTR